jgi:hypothetical protein
VLDPDELVGLPIEEIHAKIRDNLMLFKRSKSPQRESKAERAGDDVDIKTKIAKAIQPDFEGAAFQRLPYKIRPLGGGKVTYALKSSSNDRSFKTPFSGRPSFSDDQTVDASEEKPNPPPMQGRIPLPLPVPGWKMDTALTDLAAMVPLSPRLAAEPAPPPSYAKAAKYNPAMEILERYLVDFACDDVDELIKGARQTATQSVELPALSPTASPRNPRDPSLNATRSPRRASGGQKKTEDPKPEQSGNFKLPNLDVKAAVQIPPKVLPRADRQRADRQALESVRKNLEERLQKLEASGADVDEAQRREGRTNHQGSLQKSPRKTPRAELLK